jgi:hypothetical protein
VERGVGREGLENWENESCAEGPSTVSQWVGQLINQSINQQAIAYLVYANIIYPKNSWYYTNNLL